ncbi:MAG: GAK system CofD-like protein [Pseudomonadota bacterium]
MNELFIRRKITIPDLVRIKRYQGLPEFGPNILFFSGGTALNSISKELKNYTYNSTHLITTFDSGGSSAKLRKAFDMPAIGDLRSRLMALADDSIMGHPDVCKLFSHRFDMNSSQKSLIHQLKLMVSGKHPLMQEIPNPMRSLIKNQLHYFQQKMPNSFDLRGASIGNLILAGGYLNNQRQLDPIIFLFSKLVGVKGTVQSIVNENLHLSAQLKNEQLIVGQHKLTGKEVEPIKSPIKKLQLINTLKQDKKEKVEVKMTKASRKLISQAELICYPPGSFYSSLIANLLPHDIAISIAKNSCAKVYIPNLGFDPEQLGMTLDASVLTLLDYLHANAPNHSDQQLLNFILYDSKRAKYQSKLSSSLMASKGIQIIDTKLISKESTPYYDKKLLVFALLSLT